MRPVLIVHDGYHGQTAKIAGFLASCLRATGHDAHVTEPPHLATLDLSRFDGIIVGGAIHFGGVSKRLLEFVRTHQPALHSVPTAFFAVCMAASRNDERSQAEVRSYLDRFAEETGFTPTRAIAFAGALRNTQYDRLLRLLVRMVAKAEGDPTDITRDHELTDWHAVEAFAETFARDLDHVVRSAAE